MSKPPNVEQSKCFTCKFGICMKQIDEGQIVPIPKPKQEEDGEWVDSEPENDGHDHALLKGDGILGVCFWPVKAMKNDTPLQVGFVQVCNRYEKDSPKKNLTGGDPVVE